MQGEIIRTRDDLILPDTVLIIDKSMLLNPIAESYDLYAHFLEPFGGDQALRPL